MPPSRSCRTSSQVSRRPSASRPVVGSSRKSTSGRPSSASARSSLRRSPPESCLIRTRSRPARPVAASASPTGRAPLVQPAHIRTVSATLRSEEPALLEHDADPGADGGPLAERVVAEDAGGAGAGGGEALQEFDGGGLAGAVGPEEGEDLAPGDGEGDSAHGLEAAAGSPAGSLGVRTAQVGRLDRWCHASRLPAVPARRQCALSRPLLTNVMRKRSGGREATKAPVPENRGLQSLSGRRDSNSRPSPWQGDALPTEPRPHCSRPAFTGRCEHHCT